MARTARRPPHEQYDADWSGSCLVLPCACAVCGDPIETSDAAAAIRTVCEHCRRLKTQAHRNEEWKAVRRSKRNG